MTATIVPTAWRCEVPLREYRKVPGAEQFSEFPGDAIVVLETGKPPRILVDDENRVPRFA